MDIENRFVFIHGIRVHYLVTGRQDGPAVVLLHGGGVDCAYLSWEPLLGALSDTYRVIAPDLPGYGESDRPVMPYSVAFYVAFLKAFLDALDIRRSSLVGISMGGAVALGFALDSPSRVEKLVPVDSYGLQSKTAFHRLSYLFVHIPGVNEASFALMRFRPMVRYTLKSLLKRPGSITGALVDQAYHEANRPDAGLAWNTFQKDEMTWRGTRTCFMDQLGEIHAPALIVHGSQDTLVPLACSEEAIRRIPGARLCRMEGCGHWPQRDNPEVFNQVVKAFLDGSATLVASPLE